MTNQFAELNTHIWTRVLNPSVLGRKEKQRVALAVRANKKVQEDPGLPLRAEILRPEPSAGKG